MTSTQLDFHEEFSGSEEIKTEDFLNTLEKKVKRV